MDTYLSNKFKTTAVDKLAPIAKNPLFAVGKIPDELFT